MTGALPYSCPVSGAVSARRRAGAFTLIELILVMAILVIVIGLITPKLKEFFAGRALDSEARRFIALSRFGQSRAVSEGVPTMLWINTKAGTYGLQQETGYVDADTKMTDFKVDKALKIDVTKGTITTPRAGSTQTVRRGALPGIHFSPDGTVNGYTSVPAVSLQQDNQHIIWLVPSANRLGYEVQNQNGNFNNQRR